MQIQLTDDQMRGLRRAAAERGLSIAALIREAVDRFAVEQSSDDAWAEALSVVGKYHDREGKADVAEEHDRYLEDAYADWRR